jgi:hypothetical protein
MQLGICYLFSVLRFCVMQLVSGFLLSVFGFRFSVFGLCVMQLINMFKIWVSCCLFTIQVFRFINIVFSFSSPNYHFLTVFSESSICLDTKETKNHYLIPKLRDPKLKNYLKTSLRSPSRSPSRLNSRTTAAAFFCCFFTFLI